MSFISILRVIILSKYQISTCRITSNILPMPSALSLFSGAATLGLGVHWTLATTLLEDRLYDFEIVALAAGSLSTIILPILCVTRAPYLEVSRKSIGSFDSLIVGTIRKNAFTSMIVVEYSLLGIVLPRAHLLAQCSHLRSGSVQWFFSSYGWSQQPWSLNGVNYYILLDAMMFF